MTEPPQGTSLWDYLWRTSTIREPNPGNRPHCAMSAKKVFAPWCFEGRWRARRCAVVATIAAAVARKPRADPRQCSAASCPQSARVTADHPIRILFLPPYSPHMNPIEKSGGDQATVATTTASGLSSLQVTLQADLQQIVEKSGKAIVASCGYISFKESIDIRKIFINLGRFD